MTDRISTSGSSGHTLAESPTAPPKKALDADQLAEQEFADYGGDFPTPITKFAPGTAEPKTRDPSQPHNPPNFKQPQRERRLSRSSYRRPRANTGGSEWSYGDGPSLHVVDSAFADCHRVLSRRSLERHEEEEHVEENDGKDPNKVEWLENDPENPQNWTTYKKWRTMAVCCFLTLGVTFASSAPSSSTQLVASEFGVGSVVGALPITTFLLGYCLGPLIFAPASELFGRRIIFLISMAVFGIFQIQCGLAQNIETIVIGRFLAGSFASSPLTNCGGVVADIFGPVQRGLAMSVFSASVFLGPVLGPILGGFTIMNSGLGWRYVYLWIGIWAAISVVMIYFFLPETYHPQLLKNRAVKLRKEDPEKNKDKYADIEKADFSLKSIIVRTGARPAQMLATEPILLLVTIYLSVVYGLLYGLFSLFPVIWEQKRGFNPGESGLIFIGVGLGTTIGAAANVLMQRHYRELVPKWHGHPPPEERLYGAILAGPLLVGSMFWLAWTGNYPGVPWYVPALATIMLGASFSLVFISFLSYLVEVYLMFSASALAANTVIRSAVAASFPLWISQAIRAMGINWIGSLFGFIGLIIAPSPILFYFYGSRFRQGSKFAPALDLKFKEQVEKEEREKKDPNEKA
ncbi:MFS transporter [Sporobolomyces salmoneus]|uniref:MFS transporter n=1 Tax=Sporobolomyces salmoneus TaxID=183962 RepID=UPI0031815356